MTLFSLTPQEHDALENLVAHTKNGTLLRRAQAVLWVSMGERAPVVAERLCVSRQTVYNWVKRFQARRAGDIQARLSDAPRQGRPRTARGLIEPLLEAVMDRDPRELGYRFTVWTASLLRQYLQEVHHIAVSRRSVGLAIARLRRRWKRPRYDLARRAAHWRQAKGGSNEG
jgi:transposase